MSILSGSVKSGNLAYNLQSRKKARPTIDHDEINEALRTKLIVDKEMVGFSKLSGTFETINEAMLNAQNGAIIKISNDIYFE